MGFKAVYKRHTPFAISSYDYVIQGDKITLDKTGDVLLNVYLYTDSEYVDWSSINSIDMIIGGQVVSTWDTKYITKFIPLLSSSTFSKSAYNETLFFLPLPVPMLPLKNMRYHQCEFKIYWRQPLNIRCMITYAFIDEILPDTDLIIQQMSTMNVVDGSPMKIHGLVKYFVSDVLSQPSCINYSGVDVNVAPIDVYKYYHTHFGDIKYRNFVYSNVKLGMPRTCQLLGDTIFIFDSSNPIIYAFNKNTYFGVQSNYRRIQTSYPTVWTSCTDGNFIYACTVDGNFFCIDEIGNVSTLSFMGPSHEVYAMYYYNNSVYFIGNRTVTVYQLGSGSALPPISLDSDFDGSFFILGHPSYGNIILLFRDDGTPGIWIYYLDSGASVNIPVSIQDFQIIGKESVLFNSYNQLSASIQVNDTSYIASGYNNIFIVGDQEYKLDTEEQPYLTLVYDGLNYVYVYGENKVFRYEISKYSMFVPYCLSAGSSDSTGYMNFNALGDVIFKGCGSGKMYAVSYNFLRVQNGMAGLLYAY